MAWSLFSHSAIAEHSLALIRLLNNGKTMLVCSQEFTLCNHIFELWIVDSNFLVEPGESFLLLFSDFGAIFLGMGEIL